MVYDTYDTYDMYVNWGEPPDITEGGDPLDMGPAAPNIPDGPLVQ